MISAAERCNSGGGGRVSAMSKDCRMVNGGSGGVVGGFVNRCEQVLGDQNEMVMAASKIASDQTVASVNHRVYPPSTNELGKLKDLSLDNVTLIEDLSNDLSLKNEEIFDLKNQREIVSNTI